MADEFSQFLIQIKEPEEGKQFEELSEAPVSFNSEDVFLEDVHNMELIIIEMNDIPKTLFRYKMILDTQGKVLQQLEDEYARWYSGKWIEVDGEQEPQHDRQGNIIGYKKAVRTEGAKDKIIMTKYYDEYSDFQQKLRDERYKLSILKSATASIDTYSYKLHSILNYKQMLESRNIS